MKNIVYILGILCTVMCSTVDLTGQVSGNNPDILQRLKASNGSFGGGGIYLDPFIEDNYYRHLIFNQKNGTAMGWRIRIFSMSGHDAFEKANQIRSRFISRYENIPSYITYDTPDYKVYVGDCRTRSDVLKLFTEVKKDFPYAFLVSQPINIESENKRKPE